MNANSTLNSSLHKDIKKIEPQNAHASRGSFILLFDRLLDGRFLGWNPNESLSFCTTLDPGVNFFPNRNSQSSLREWHWCITPHRLSNRFCPANRIHNLHYRAHMRWWGLATCQIWNRGAVQASQFCQLPEITESVNVSAQISEREFPQISILTFRASWVYPVTQSISFLYFGWFQLK